MEHLGIINIQIAQAMIDRFHVDEGCTTNILQLLVVQQMGMETKINKSVTSLTGFHGATTVTVGTIELNVFSTPVISSQTFMIIDEVSPTIASWAGHGLARLMTSLPPHTRRCATQSLGWC
ncbi:hypothetical protein L3X38_011439 [Prunus dulcis]|uniref:Uncharacterized protein n=1 Tax=Prunus dulcis TaxID=3755 RepID=A0AAD4WHD5_PRUDU|nr:hypothetical protein L3X38_011439 [Prunus dulcis]